MFKKSSSQIIFSQHDDMRYIIFSQHDDMRYIICLLRMGKIGEFSIVINTRIQTARASKPLVLFIPVSIRKLNRLLQI